MLAQPLQLHAPAGPLILDTNLLLAPIAGWCDLAWRLTVRELGSVALACTDLLSPHGLIRGSEQAAELARSHPDDHPLCMQLYGSDPAVLADGARWCADHGAAVVDINMGCPVDKVCKKDGGSRLMTDPDRAVRIATACRTVLPDHIPLTAKMRLGWSEADAKRGAAGELACKLIDAGIGAITVHGRTTEQRFKGRCRRPEIKQVVDRVRAHNPRIPVIANGDIRTPENVISMLQETNAAGVMIGRGAFAMPWIFHAAWQLQLCTQHIPPNAQSPIPNASSSPIAQSPIPNASPSDPEKLAIIRRYFDRMLDFRGGHHALHTIRPRISSLARHINRGHCKPLKEAIRTAQSPAQVHAALDAWEAGTPEQPLRQTEAHRSYEPRVEASGFGVRKHNPLAPTRGS